MRETSEKKNVLKALELIDSELRSSKMDVDLVDSLELVDEVMEYLDVSKNLALMFSVIFSFQVNDRTCDFKNIASYLDISPYSALALKKDLEELLNRGYLAITGSGYRRARSKKETFYLVNDNLYSCIVDGKPFPKDMLKSELTSIEWLERISEFIEEEAELLESYKIEERFEYFLNVKTTNGISTYFRDLEMDNFDKLLVVCTIWNEFVKNEGTSPNDFADSMGKSYLHSKTLKNKLINSKHKAQTLELIDVRPSRFADDIELVVHEAFKLKLKDFDLSFENDDVSKKSGITMKSDEIKPKVMHYSKSAEKQLKHLESILEPKAFVKMQERMLEKGMNKGVATLFFGEPGTGKTETVKQLARKLGRDIIQVDVSDAKSMWFGQSQKKVKAIFTKYKDACKNIKNTPILLINEADAILSRRKNDISAPTAQTENAIQNIFLEEIENLEGILIATTNLEGNLDSAFDRRFLFKIKYEKPDFKGRFEIWKQKDLKLSEAALKRIAASFELTGGQIDNIIKKVEMDYILNADEPSEKILNDYANEELSLSKKSTRKIGFQ